MARNIRKRRAAATVCREPGCPELAPCPLHPDVPWRGVRQRRPRSDGQSGWGIQKRNKAILGESGGICHICGLPGADIVDHVVPLAEGGTDNLDNLKPAHFHPCHREKTSAESRRGKTRGR